MITLNFVNPYIEYVNTIAYLNQPITESHVTVIEITTGLSSTTTMEKHLYDMRNFIKRKIEGSTGIMSPSVCSRIIRNSN